MMSNKKLKKVILVAGARPNFMKIAPIMKEMKKYPDRFKPIFVHTGQHYDDNMSKIFLHDLRLPEPDVYLGVGSASHAVQTAKVMMEFEKVLEKEKPDLVVVVGDVNSTLACALVASKMYIPIAHVEAGLRSFDRTMPEEINRVLTDQISDILFTTCEDAEDNLKREGIQEETTFFKVPCITIRENTERPITVTEGTNVIVGTDPDRVFKESRVIINGNGKNGRIPEFWDDGVSGRIVEVISKLWQI